MRPPPRARARALPLLLLSASLAAGCASGPQRPAGGAPTLGPAQLELGRQELTGALLQLSLEASSSLPARALGARWELVVDGQVVERGETALERELPPGGATALGFPVALTLARSDAELRALSERGGSLLVAVRGELGVRVGRATHALPFAASRPLRAPRLPTVSLAQVDAARYSTGEVRLQLSLGVTNPNAFAVRLESLTYRVALAGHALAEGSRAHDTLLAPGATALHEVDVEAGEGRHGAELASRLRAGALPYRVEGELRAPGFRVPYLLEGAATGALAR